MGGGGKGEEQTKGCADVCSPRPAKVRAKGHKQRIFGKTETNTHPRNMLWWPKGERSWRRKKKKKGGELKNERRGTKL